MIMSKLSIGAYRYFDNTLCKKVKYQIWNGLETEMLHRFSVISGALI